MSDGSLLLIPALPEVYSWDHVVLDMPPPPTKGICDQVNMGKDLSCIPLCKILRFFKAYINCTRMISTKETCFTSLTECFSNKLDDRTYFLLTKY